MASLYGNKKRLTSLNSNVAGKSTSLLNAKSLNPYRSSDVLAESELEFKTAIPKPDNYKRIKESLAYVSATNLPGTCFKTINSGVYGTPTFFINNQIRGFLHGL